MDDITGPFKVDDSSRFLYDGPGGPYYWNVCKGHDYEDQLYLSTEKPEDCITDITLLAQRFEDI